VKLIVLVNFGAICVAGLLFLLPGLTLLLWLLPDLDEDWFGWLSLSGGLSLAVFPLLFLWARVIGVRLGPVVFWAMMGVCALLIVWRLRSRPNILGAVNNTPLRVSLLLVASASIVLGVRLWAIRGLHIPLWGDSVQHAVIAQLLVEHGGLFDSWLPYAPYQSLTVHFGFHACVAALQWMMGMEAAPATLLVGQFINALAVFALYPLAMRVTKGNRWASVGTMLVVGLIFSMPGFYVNWGRYPQLSGQAILPVALWLAIWAMAPGQSRWPFAILAGIAAAGMSLSYYRIPFYYAVFVLIWLVGDVFLMRRDNKSLLPIIASLAAIGSTAAALLFPWIRYVMDFKLAEWVVRSVIAGPSSSSTSILNQLSAEYWGWIQIIAPLEWLFLGVAGIAGVWSIVRRQWAVAAVGLWMVGLILLPAGRLIHLPGAAQMTLFAINIALYIPEGMLIGWLLSEAMSWLLRRGSAGYVGTVLVLVFGLGLGLMRQTNIVKPDYIMVTQPDLVAMDWIRANTPEDARFLVNGSLIYSGRSVVGSDAGWWIPLLARRQNTMPPQYALLNEVPINPTYNQDIVSLVTRLQEIPLSSPEGISLLCQQGISHVYMGDRQGLVGQEAVPLFMPDEMLDSFAFSPQYHEDRVWIFSFDRSTCATDANGSD
jgi:hypothetical protein